MILKIGTSDVDELSEISDCLTASNNIICNPSSSLTQK